EDGRGRLGHAATRRFPSPLVEPDVPISGIRLSDWLHREAHNGTVRGRRSRRSRPRSEEHTSELQSLTNLVCRLLLEKKKQYNHRERTQASDDDDNETKDTPRLHHHDSPRPRAFRTEPRPSVRSRAYRAPSVRFAPCA